MNQGLTNLLLLVVLVLRPACVAAESWEWISPRPQGNSLAAVAYGNGKFLAVGEFGAVLTSSDGAAWTVENRLGRETIETIVYGDGQFIAGGRQGGFWKTPDGATWTPITLPTKFRGSPIDALAYGGGKFWTLTASELYSSSDALQWRFETNLFGSVPLRIVFANDRVVGVSGKQVFVYDTLAVTNALATVTLPQTAFCLTYGNGFFVAGAERGYILASDSGTNWLAIKARSDDASLRAITFGGGTFVATTWNDMISSADLLDWTPPTNVLGNALALAYGGGRFVGVGSSGNLVLSTNGQVWTNLTKPSHAFFNTIAYTTNGFVAAGDNGALRVLPPLTQQLLPWSEAVSITAVAPYAGSTIAVGFNYDLNAGVVLDLSNHSTLRSIPETFLFDVTVAASGTLVAVGSLGTVLRRVGSTWTVQQIPEYAELHTVTSGASGFVAAGENGVVMKSANGSQWTQQALAGENFKGAAYGNGRYVLVSQFGGFWSSTNGAAWTMTQKTSDVLMNVIYSPEGVFIASGSGLFFSFDGIHWTRSSLPSGYTFYDTASAGGTFVTVSYENTILAGGALIFPDLKKDAATFTMRALESRWRSRPGLVQSSEDLVHWRDEKDLTALPEQDFYQFEDVNATVPQRYYRIVSPSLNWE